MKKFNRILSFLTAMCLMCSLTLPALAAEYYLEDGDIHIEATSTDGGVTQTQTVTQNSVSTPDAAPVVTQRDSSTATSNNVTIESSGGATAVVTVENVNIDTGTGTPGGDTSPIDVANDSQAIITVSGENHVNAGHDVSGNYDDAAAVHVGDSTVVIQGDASDGADTLNVTNGHTDGAAIGSDYNEAFSGELTIRDVTVTTTDGNIGAGMLGEFSGTLVIENADVTAGGGYLNAGIGTGGYGDFTETGTVIITGGSTVEATGAFEGAGIGGGQSGDYSGTVIVAGNSTVTAEGTVGAGIGGGQSGDYSGTVIVAGDSTVTAKSERGAGIGTGSDNNDYNGTVIQEDGSTITGTGGRDGNGLGSQDYPKNAEVKDTVDLTGYPVPEAPAPLPWNESMFPKDPDPTPDPTPIPDPVPVPDPTPDPAPDGTAEEVSAPRPQDTFWTNVEKQIRAAKKGDTVTVDATWRTTMPASIMDAIAETGVTLIIKWNGGEDITIDKPYDGEKQYTIFYLKDLAELLAD